MGMGDRWGAGQREGKRKRGLGREAPGGSREDGRDERERKEEELVDIDRRK